MRETATVRRQDSIQTRLTGMIAVTLAVTLLVNLFIYRQVALMVRTIDAVFASNVTISELTEDLDLVPALMDYYHRHLADGTFVSWLALDGERIVGTSGMSFVEKPPYFSCPSGRIGLLSSMYTDPEYRRRGIASELLKRVTDEARAYGCGSVQITASDMGVLLYSDFGFVRNGNFMQYKL